MSIILAARFPVNESAPSFWGAPVGDDAAGKPGNGGIPNVYVALTRHVYVDIAMIPPIP
ncbi:hypothetical protein [Agromyces sp. NPDC056965]|uniref:hypothetical protein n=1 Tax=Agromyces sp. NPDC056965 TaxID=3345983 RepID=UPI0036306CDF